MTTIHHIGLSGARASALGAAAWPNWIGVPGVENARPLVAVLSQSLGQMSVYVDSGAVTTATLAADTLNSAENEATIRTRAAAALSTNTTYLAVASPTTAQVTAQVNAVTKECSAVIRLLLGQLDSLTGT